MWLASLSAKRPVLAAVASIVLIVLGVVSLTRVNVRQYPDVDPPVVSISTTYRGAPAAVVDADVTKRILDRLVGIEDVRQIDATSTDNRSSIDVEFALSRDLDLAAADVRDAVSRVRSELPETVEDPEVRKASASSSPIMWLTLTSDRLDTLQLTDYADRQLEERLSTVNGVARVRISGERRYAVRVNLDSARMAAAGVTVGDIASRLREENVEVASGRLEGVSREFVLRSLSRLESPEEFERLVIRDPGNDMTNAAGGAAPVRLGDVADVSLGAESYRNLLRAGFADGVGLGVVRQSNANTIAVVDAVRAELEDILPTLPQGVELTVSTDDSTYIRQSIREVIITLLISVSLVVLVILLFLGSWRATIVPAVAIPVSIVGAALTLYAFDFSLNVLTLLAAVLAIGLVVDDAIVVLENIARRIEEEGEPPLLASVRGTAEVGLAVVATTVVLVAVFVPISFLTGKVGRLFTEFGVLLAVAVICSSFVALTAGTMIAGRVLKKKDEDDESAGRWGKTKRILGKPYGWLVAAGVRVRDAYAVSVGWTLKARWLVLGAMAGVGGLAVLFFYLLPSELTPTEDQARVLTFIEGPEGATLEYTKKQIAKAENLFRDRYGGEGGPLATIVTIAPDFRSDEAVNTAILIVKLKDFGERTKKPNEIIDEMRPVLAAEMPGARVFSTQPPGLGLRGNQQPVQFVLNGPTFEDVRGWAKTIEAAARETGQFADLRADIDATKPQYEVRYDRDRMENLGVSVSDVGQALQAFFGGLEVTDYLDRGEIYEVVLQAPRESRGSLSDLRGVYVRSDRTGALVPLDAIVTTELRGATRNLRRIDRSPAVVIEGGLAPGVTLGDGLDTLNRLVREKLPETARVNYLGESLEFEESGNQLYYVFGLALVLVYLSLAAQFGSFVHPITIMLAVPLAVTGGLFSTWITGGTLNIYTQIGIVLLVGLTTKNGILLVEFANQVRDGGEDVSEAARRAAKVRLRPILMTAISTILGAVPLVLAGGAGAEGRVAIGWVIIGGMTLSTFLTLFGVPALYAILAPLTKPGNAAENLLREQEQGRDEAAGGRFAEAEPAYAGNGNGNGNGSRNGNGRH